MSRYRQQTKHYHADNGAKKKPNNRTQTVSMHEASSKALVYSA